MTAIRRDRLWLPVAVVAAALVVLTGWMMFIGPQNGSSATLSDQTSTVGTQISVLRQRVSELQAQSKDGQKYRDQLVAAQTALPTSAELSTFLRSMQQLGTSAGVSVSAMSATTPTPLLNSSPGSAAVQPATGRAIYQIPISITATGDPGALATFLQQLQQHQPRAVLITSLSQQAAGDKTSLQVNLQAFMAPAPGTSSAPK